MRIQRGIDSLDKRHAVANQSHPRAWAPISDWLGCAMYEGFDGSPYVIRDLFD